MSKDSRARVAKYYDLQSFPNDVPFYVERIPSPEARALELGCGTGRVLIPLAAHCAQIVGVDISDAMLEVCRRKLARPGAPGNVRVEGADITAFDLGRAFDLAIAPFRVFQNLQTDAQVDGFFACVRRHLAPGGTCILNVFRPWDEERIREAWGRQDEASFQSVMRCRGPDEFEELIGSHGFRIVGRWGGYGGEAYGEGPELVIQFAEAVR